MCAVMKSMHGCPAQGAVRVLSRRGLTADVDQGGHPDPRREVSFPSPDLEDFDMNTVATEVRILDALLGRLPHALCRTP
jgi:hypothetical protein